MTALYVLGALAAFAVIASELPKMVSVPLACASLLYGVRLAKREGRRGACEFVIPAEQAPLTVTGEAVHDLEVQWRGPLAFLRWQGGDGKVRHLQGWPDNLDPASRRELRLAITARAPAHAARSMAP